MNKIRILGSDISIINSYNEAYEEILSFVKKEDKGYVTINNVHTVVTAVRENQYREIINKSYLSLPDGRPLSVVAKLKSENQISRIFGPTFFEKSLAWGVNDGIKHFLFGGTVATQEKIINKISKTLPDCIIAGRIVPPFKEFTEEENSNFINKINSSDADIIWVALGAPKQEKWIFENYKKLKKGLMIGIGAGFDYYAGNLKHAPDWMKNYSLEWLYRLLQEPGRLWKRYLTTNSLFLWYIALEFLRIRKFD